MSTPIATPPAKPRGRRRFLLAVLVLIVAGLGWWHRYVEAAYARLAYNFARVEGPFDVRYQAGQEERANAVASMMDDAVRRIENILSTKVNRPVILCLRTESEYATYSASAGSRGSCTVLGEVCLSPKIQDNNAELRRILVHEMTHAAVLQRIGAWKQLRKVPAWFDEGLAVYVSEGGGAEKVSEGEAGKAILAGEHFDPERTGKLYADAFGLSAHVFYRQAGMFVGHLIKETPSFVPSILTELERGLDFPDAFERAAGLSISGAWARFQASLSSTLP